MAWSKRSNFSICSLRHACASSKGLALSDLSQFVEAMPAEVSSMSVSNLYRRRRADSVCLGETETTSPSNSNHVRDGTYWHFLIFSVVKSAARS
jgi:hypothetical protein